MRKNWRALLLCVVLLVGAFSGSGRAELSVAEDVRRAMDAADRLSTGSYMLLEDGSVAVRGESFENLAGDCAMLDGVRKIADSSSEMQLFALTQSGDVYYRQTKILSGAQDIIYSTTNTNQTAIALVGGKIVRLVVRDTSDVNPDLRAASPDTYFDVGGKTVNYYDVTSNFSDLNPDSKTVVSGELARLSAEKSDFFVLNDAGQVFMDNNGGTSEEYVGMDFFGWENIAVIDAAKRMLSDAKDDQRECELTVAGIQADGTVLASGHYAEAILSWGRLSFITMEDGLIVGLAPDGTLKTAGPVAEFVEGELAGWSNIIGVQVGSMGGTMVVNAVDGDGVYHHLEYDERWAENVVATVSLANGCADNKGEAWYQYCPDGTVRRSTGSGWE